MSSQTLNSLRQLKLPGMAGALQTQLEQVGTYESLAFLERLMHNAHRLSQTVHVQPESVFIFAGIRII